MSLYAGDFADTVIGILENLERLKFSQIAQTLQNYEVMSKWLKKDRVTFTGGRSLKRTLMDTTLGAARDVGLFDEDQILHGDHLFEMTVPWVHANTHWSVEYRKDVLMNTGEALVQDVIVPRRVGAMIDMAKLLEDRGWGCPASSTTEGIAYGLTYWITGHASEGFYGGPAYNHTLKGNVNCTTHPNFKNQSRIYANMTYDDCIYEMRLAHYYMGYQSPFAMPSEVRKDAEQQYRIYCDGTTGLKFDDIAREQNENIGNDVAAKDGVSVFKGHPIIQVPWLDSNTVTTGDANATMVHPIYMVDHSSFKVGVLKGDYLREKVTTASKQSNITVTNVWLTYQFYCTNPRVNAVIYATS